MKNNLTVSIKAKALASGSKGDMVAVQNADNKKIYYGEVINKNIVKVNI
ncbi:flagella basal body P-ring formation protein FlgA [bacterium]|nr:flagella basal body P-ring formation protein FlgA [bacterium]